MPYQMSQSAKKALELLVNSRDLCVKRQQRPLATDVAKVCRILVKSSISPETPELDVLIHGIPGKMRDELEELFITATQSIKSADMIRYQESVRKSKTGLPDWSTLPH